MTDTEAIKQVITQAVFKAAKAAVLLATEMNETGRSYIQSSKNQETEETARTRSGIYCQAAGVQLECQRQVHRAKKTL